MQWGGDEDEGDELSPSARLELFFKKSVKMLGVHNRLPEIFVSEKSIVNGQTVGRKVAIDDPRTTRQFAQLYSVAALVMDLLASGKTMSQRDVYYSLKSLFSTQAKSNATILDLGLILGLKRHEMGIHAGAKGLIAGPLRFRFLPEDVDRGDEEGDGEEGAAEREVPPWQDCLAAGASGSGVRITSHWLSSSERVEAELPPPQSALPRPRYLVVIEKEGIFSRLVEDEAYLKLPAILMTACGYPDVASRACVSRIAELFPELTVLGLCDYNSYGLAVLLCYKLPTETMRFEARGLQCQELHWLGLRTPHIEKMTGLGLDASHLQAATERDKRQGRALQRSAKLDQVPDVWGQELEAMLEAGVKVELESLYSLGLEACCDWLVAAVEEEDYI